MSLCLYLYSAAILLFYCIVLRTQKHLQYLRSTETMLLPVSSMMHDRTLLYVAKNSPRKEAEAESARVPQQRNERKAGTTKRPHDTFHNQKKTRPNLLTKLGPQAGLSTPMRPSKNQS